MKQPCCVNVNSYFILISLMFDCEMSNFAYVNHTLSIPGIDQYYKQLENNRSIH